MIPYGEDKARNVDVLFQQAMPEEAGALHRYRQMNVDEAIEECVARMIQP